MTVSKTDLIKKVAEATELSQKNVATVLNATLAEIQNQLVAGEKVQLLGFGTFMTRERAERKGRNPQTADEIIIPASTVPAFKAGQALKDAVKN